MPSPQAGQRSTMRLAATHSTRAVGLDFDTDTGVEYARHWAHKHCGQTPPAAGIVRRALAVYLAHLSAPSTDPHGECRALARACAPMRRDAEHQQGTHKRLGEATASACMPTWAEVATPPQQRALLDHMGAWLDRTEAPSPVALNPSACAQGGPPLPPRSTP